MAFKELFRGWKDVEEFDKAGVIFKERDKAGEMYFILSGQVDLALHGNVFDQASEGGIVGEMAILESAEQIATATASKGTKLARINRSQLNELINGNAEFSKHVMAVLATRLRAVDHYISQQTSEKG